MRPRFAIKTKVKGFQMPISENHSRMELEDEVIDRILELATTASTEDDVETLDIFRGAVSKAREGKEELNEEYRGILDNTLEMPSAFVQRLLANDPSGRSLWLLEYDLQNAAKTLMWLTSHLGYRDLGALAVQGFHHARNLHQVCDLLAAEIKMFRKQTELPSGYLPRWNHEIRNGCIRCPKEAAEALIVCESCSGNSQGDVAETDGA